MPTQPLPRDAQKALDVQLAAIRRMGAGQVQIDKYRRDFTEGYHKGCVSERKRWKAVYSSREFQHRETQAQHLLTESDLTSEQIIGALAASPVIREQRGPGLLERMRAEGSPNLGVDGSADGDGDPTPQSVASRIVGDFVAATGKQDDDESDG